MAGAGPKFCEANHADVVIRYYSDNVTRILKPLQMEGPFLSTFDRDGVLDLAKKQAGRELAVVILLQFNASDRIKQSWQAPLKQLGYRRVVFLRAEPGLKVDGLSILEGPAELTDRQNQPAKPNV